MQHAFGSSSPFSLGIEEEFQLVSAESYELVPRFDEVADAAQDERVRQARSSACSSEAPGRTSSAGLRSREGAFCRWRAGWRLRRSELLASRAVGYPPDRLAPPERAPSCFKAL